MPAIGSYISSYRPQAIRQPGGSGNQAISKGLQQLGGALADLEIAAEKQAGDAQRLGEFVARKSAMSESIDNLAAELDNDPDHTTYLDRAKKGIEQIHKDTLAGVNDPALAAHLTEYAAGTRDRFVQGARAESMKKKMQYTEGVLTADIDRSVKSGDVKGIDASISAGVTGGVWSPVQGMAHRSGSYAAVVAGLLTKDDPDSIAAAKKMMSEHADKIAAPTLAVLSEKIKPAEGRAFAATVAHLPLGQQIAAADNLSDPVIRKAAIAEVELRDRVVTAKQNAESADEIESFNDLIRKDPTFRPTREEIEEGFSHLPAATRSTLDALVKKQYSDEDWETERVNKDAVSVWTGRIMGGEKVNLDEVRADESLNSTGLAHLKTLATMMENETQHAALKEYHASIFVAGKRPKQKDIDRDPRLEYSGMEQVKSWVKESELKATGGVDPKDQVKILRNQQWMRTYERIQAGDIKDQNQLKGAMTRGDFDPDDFRSLFGTLKEAQTPDNQTAEVIRQANEKYASELKDGDKKAKFSRLFNDQLLQHKAEAKGKIIPFSEMMGIADEIMKPEVEKSIFRPSTWGGGPFDQENPPTAAEMHAKKLRMKYPTVRWDASLGAYITEYGKDYVKAIDTETGEVKTIKVRVRGAK